jgi:predicted DNA-binding protein
MHARTAHEGKSERTMVAISAALGQRLRAYAEREGRIMRTIIERALERYLDEHEKGGKK